MGRRTDTPGSPALVPEDDLAVQQVVRRYECVLEGDHALHAEVEEREADEDVVPGQLADDPIVGSQMQGRGRGWTEDQRTRRDALSDLAVLARNGDEMWQEVQATEDASALARAGEVLLSLILR